jgi:hypothetical protein
MNPSTISAVRDFVRGLPDMCEDVARRAQAEQLLIARTEGKMGRMKHVNEVTRARLEDDLVQSSLRLEQFRRAFTGLRCNLE